MLVIELPFLPISVNQSLCYRNGRAVSTHQANSFRKYAREEIERHLNNLGPEYLSVLLEGWKGRELELTLTFYSDTWKTKAGTIRKKDVGNLEKGISDILFTCLCNYCEDLDDSQITKITLLKVDSADNNKSIIELKEYKEIENKDI